MLRTWQVCNKWRLVTDIFNRLGGRKGGGLALNAGHPHARHCVKLFVFITSSSQQLYKKMLVSPSYRWKHWGLEFAWCAQWYRARKRGSWDVNPGSSSPLSSVVPAFLEWVSSLCVYVLIWKVKTGICGTHFLSLIAGLLNDCSSSACTFGTKQWAKKMISPFLWPTSFPAASCELGACVHGNPNHCTEPALKGLTVWQSESDRYRCQKVIRAKRKVGARKSYRNLGEKYTQTHMQICREKTGNFWVAGY